MVPIINEDNNDSNVISNSNCDNDNDNDNDKDNDNDNENENVFDEDINNKVKATSKTTINA